MFGRIAALSQGQKFDSEKKKAPVLNQPISIITGASRGIGRAIALRFAKEEMAIVLVGRDKSALQVSLSDQE